MDTPSENPRRFADLTDWDDRRYWQRVISRAGPRAKEIQYVCSIRLDGIHWSFAHSVLSARECARATLGDPIRRKFNVVARLESTVAEVLGAVLVQESNTDFVSMMTCGWYDSHRVKFSNGAIAHVTAIGRRAIYVRVYFGDPDCPPPTFHVLTRTTKEFADLYVVANCAVARWNGKGEYRSSRPPPEPGAARPCEIEVPRPHVFSTEHVVNATADRDR